MYSIQPANFLDHYRTERKKKNPWIFFIVLIALIALGVASVFAARSVLRIVDYTQKAKDHLLYSVTLLRDQQFAYARTNIASAQYYLRSVQEDLSGLRAIAAVPVLGRQVRAFTYTIATIDRLSIAMDRGAQFANKLVTTIVGNKPLHFSEITPEQKRLFLAQLFEASPVLQGIKSDVDLAMLSLARVPDRFLLPPLASAVEPLKMQLPRAQHSLQIALPLLDALPLVSGYPKAQRYLFLFQNNDELRPTGGFIGTYGILDLRDGEIQSLFTDNIYRLDRLADREKRLRVVPPAPIKTHLNLKYWFLRDVNWSPDFPTTAKQALAFYQKESKDPLPIDGVLAITPTVVVRLLELLGPITVGDVQFTSKNLVDTLQFYVEKGYVEVGLPDIERKEIIGKLTKEIVHRLSTLPLTQIPDLLDIFEGAMRERHVLIYETNPALQTLVTNQGWDGRVRDATNDFLMVVDANLGALKTDSVMDRSITYTVTPDPRRLKATLAVTYHNRGLFSWKTTRYRTYTRVYVPRGAELLRSEGFITEDKKREAKKAELSEDLGKTVFGGYLIIEPRETKTVTLEYLLPPTMAPSSYTLYAQKQAGTEAHPLLVRLQFGKKIKGWQPTGFHVVRKGDTITFPTDLRVDRQFTIEF